MTFSENTDLFLEEAQELLEKAEAALLSLEKRPDDRELVNEVFRALHTIKGSGAMFGFSAVSGFTHSVENLFDEVRKGKQAVDPGIIDIGLRAVDGISRLLTNPEVSEDLKILLKDIEAKEKGTIPRVQPPPPPVSPVPPMVPDGPTKAPDNAMPLAWRISIRPQAQILNRGVKLEPLFRELTELGQCHIQALTEGVPDLETLDPTSLYLSWNITLATTANLANIRAVFLFVEDYMDLKIDPIEPSEPSVDGTGPMAPKLGEILVSRGQLKPEQVDTIRQAQKTFGEVAVGEGMVHKDHIEAALGEQTIVRTTNIEREIRQEAVTIRVRKDKLDTLIDLVGELVILQAILEMESKKETSGTFEALSESLARLAADLRDTTMSIRMVPLEESFSSFHRLVRDLSNQVGKELKLEITGGSTELDKNIVEALKDPLVHIIRNTADHGIEAPEVRQMLGKPAAGTIAVSAKQVGSRVEITVADDGAGLNLEKIKTRAVEKRLLDPNETDEGRIQMMIFEPGFSTAEKTTGLSGRGVGMDVVKRNVEKLRGEVALKSVPGQGMTITLSIPLTLVIIEGLVVRIGNFDYVITLSQVEECVDLTPEIRVGKGKVTVINLRGKTIPVLPLREGLGIPGNTADDGRLVIVNNEGTTVALMVDAVVGRKQVVIKPLSAAVRRIKVLSGATILGDGTVALILDVGEIIKKQAVE